MGRRHGRRHKRGPAYPEDGPWMEDDVVVWKARRSFTCVQCGAHIRKKRDDLAGYHKDGKQWRATCLKCLGLDGLAFLPAGDARVTRRATKYASSRAVVAHRRGRYLRRLGILVEEDAIRRACDDYDVNVPDNLRARDVAAPTERHDFEAPKTVASAKPNRPNTPQSCRQSQLTVAKPDAAPAAERFVSDFVSRLRERYPRCSKEKAREIARFGLQTSDVGDIECVEIGSVLARYFRRSSR